jgi:hypothetical protein
MQRTINHTGRRKLQRNEVTLKLTERSNEAPVFDIEFELNRDNLPDEAAIYLEAYNGSTQQRFECGSVGDIQIPEDRALDQLDLTGKPLFRVRIVDESSHIGRLLASAQALRAESEDEEQRASLMTLASRPLGQQTWRVNIREADKPELVINSAIPDAIGQLKENVVFQALILPAAFRQVLMFYLWDDEFEEGTPQTQWLALAEHFAGEKPHSKDTAELCEWVDRVVDRFSEQFKLRENLNLKLEGSA